MMSPDRLKLCLEDVLADLWHARRIEDLGQLTLLMHFDLRRWALSAGQELLVQGTRDLMLGCPHSSRVEFLQKVDKLIAEAERAHERLALAGREHVLESVE